MSIDNKKKFKNGRLDPTCVFCIVIQASRRVQRIKTHICPHYIISGYCVTDLAGSGPSPVASSAIFQVSKESWASTFLKLPLARTCNQWTGRLRGPTLVLGSFPLYLICVVQDPLEGLLKVNCRARAGSNPEGYLVTPLDIPERCASSL